MTTATQVLQADLVAAQNDKLRAALAADYAALGEALARRGVDIGLLKAKAAAFSVAVPSWGVGTGGTRFARFPGPGEPRGILDKLEDCAVINQLTRCTPRVSLHIPWDRTDDPAELRGVAEALGLGFDAMNSNTFQDSPGQKLSYKFGVAQPYRSGGAAAGDRAQSRMHPPRPGARLPGADGLDRRRLEFPRPEPFRPRSSSAIWNRSGSSIPTCRAIGGSSPSTSSTSRPSIPPSCRTGAPTS